MAKSVLAVCFDDKIGYDGINLYEGYWYAECSKDYKKKDFSALGHLPYKHRLKITYKGRSIVAMKGDVQSCGPNHPAIALHRNVCNKLKFPCTLDHVTIKQA